MSSELTPFKHAVMRLKCSRDESDEERKAVINELIALYVDVAQQDEALARQVRQLFLSELMNEPKIWVEANLFQLLTEHFKPEDLDGLRWQDPGQVISLCEILYSFQFPSETHAEQIKTHVQTLLQHALQQFEQQKEFEKMFQLLHLTPSYASLIEETEFFRLRNRAYMYETRRVQRNRYFLHGYLTLYVILITIVFPLLFINAENGAIQDKIEQAAEVDMDEENRQFLSYSDGLYWSVITASSIGYGDVTPVTQVGRIIAATLGIMGVITVAVIAGLILEWITPRRLD